MRIGINNTQIIGAGCFLPQKITNTRDLLASVDSYNRFGFKENYIEKKIGIISLRTAEFAMMPSEMAAIAAENALLQSDVLAKDLDLIIYCGIAKDYFEPATAHYVQNMLGASNARCLDIMNACHGVMDGIDYAKEKIKNGSIKKALICTAEKQSITHKVLIDQINDPAFTKEEFLSKMPLFTAGDAGGALVLQSTNSEECIGDIWFKSEGSQTNLCEYKLENNRVVGGSNMKKIIQESVKTHHKQSENTLNKLGWKPDEVDHFIVHQTGTRPCQGYALAGNISQDKITFTYPWLGNIASATIPVVLSISKIKKGQKIFFMTAGSGLTSGQTGAVAAYDNMVFNPSINSDILKNLANYNSEKRVAA